MYTIICITKGKVCPLIVQKFCYSVYHEIETGRISLAILNDNAWSWSRGLQ